MEASPRASATTSARAALLFPADRGEVIEGFIRGSDESAVKICYERRTIFSGD
jgi:hypothetical protein